MEGIQSEGGGCLCRNATIAAEKVKERERKKEPSDHSIRRIFFPLPLWEGVMADKRERATTK